MRVLVVDDDAVVLESCRRILAAEGHDVQLAASADEALDFLRSGQFNLLVVDVKMPVHDVWWLVPRATACAPSVPVLAMSGYPTQETMCDVRRLGAFGFISKPFTPDELLDMVRSALAKEPGP